VKYPRQAELFDDAPKYHVIASNRGDRHIRDRGIWGVIWTVLERIMVSNTTSIYTRFGGR
jgi:hypothetical protein